jgi:hypothetical protein
MDAPDQVVLALRQPVGGMPQLLDGELGAGATHRMAPGEHTRHNRPSGPVMTRLSFPIAAPSNSAGLPRAAFVHRAGEHPHVRPAGLHRHDGFARARRRARRPSHPARPARAHANLFKTRLVLFMACTTFWVWTFSSVMPDSLQIIETLLRQQTPVAFQAHGPSMNPTIRDGDRIRVLPLSVATLNTGLRRTVPDSWENYSTPFAY